MTPAAQYASVDTTSRCPLQCSHCYFYRNPVEGDDLSDEAFLGGLRAARDERGIDCMLWLGGEPLARPEVVVEGARLFRRNGLFTSGLLPIPEDFSGGVAISLDGGPNDNDRLRGAGAFNRVMDRIGGAEGRIFHCTVTRENVGSLEELAADLDRGGATGLLFGLYSPRCGETGAWSLSEREQEVVVDGLQALRREHSFVLNTPSSLELMRPRNQAGVASTCLYRTGGAVAFDHRLGVKLPCSYGLGADCSRCGCAALYLRAAAAGGDGEARAALSALFRRR